MADITITQPGFCVRAVWFYLWKRVAEKLQSFGERYPLKCCFVQFGDSCTLTCNLMIFDRASWIDYTGLFISLSGISDPCGTGMVTPKGSMSTEGETLQVSVLPYRCSICTPLVTRHHHNWLSFGKFQDTERFLIYCARHFSSRLPPSGGTCKYAKAPSTKKTLKDSVPIDMLLSAVSVLVVAQSSSEVPEGLMNNPVLY